MGSLSFSVILPSILHWFPSVSNSNSVPWVITTTENSLHPTCKTKTLSTPLAKLELSPPHLQNYHKLKVWDFLNMCGLKVGSLPFRPMIYSSLCFCRNHLSIHPHISRNRTIQDIELSLDIRNNNKFSSLCSSIYQLFLPI